MKTTKTHEWSHSTTSQFRDKRGPLAMPPSVEAPAAPIAAPSDRNLSVGGFPTASPAPFTWVSMVEGVYAQVSVFMPELHVHKAQGNSGRDHYSLHPSLAAVLALLFTSRTTLMFE
jgi:hypothetical protein